MASQILVLNYGGRTFTFTKEHLCEAMDFVTRLVVETKGEFSHGDAARVCRMMHDIAWQEDQIANEPRCYKVRITRWSTNTTITLSESMRGEKFESMRRLSWKYSQQYGSQWEIDVSVIEDDEAVRIINQMHGVFSDE